MANAAESAGQSPQPPARPRPRVLPGLVFAFAMLVGAGWFGWQAWLSWLAQTQAVEQAAVAGETLRQLEIETAAMDRLLASLGSPVCAANERLVTGTP